MALRFLSWFCPHHLYEEIEGDLIQQFQRDVKLFGERKAKRRFVWNTIRFLRPGIVLRNKFSTPLNQFDMLNHFFKMFFRVTLKNKGYSLLNTSGLAIGLTCFIFIFLWVINEVSYDEFHTDGKRIFSVQSNHAYSSGEVFTSPETPGNLSEALKDLPGVEESGRVVFRDKFLVNYKDQSYYEPAAFADSSVFRIFTFSIRSGDAVHPLTDLSSVAISQSLAVKYFGYEDPIGKTIKVNNRRDVRVTSVFKDLPKTSTIQFQLVLPYEIYGNNDQYNKEWGAWTGGNTYVKLFNDADQLEIVKRVSSQITHPKIWPRWGENVELSLYPMTAWHLYDQFENGKPAGGQITYVRIFIVIALCILLIACINFANLSTARSLSRSKEIGVRKVIGAAKGSLKLQFERAFCSPYYFTNANFF